jgi:hypothetical protein
MASKFAISTLPVDEIIRGLAKQGALSLPLLNDAFRHQLLAEAHSAAFRPARESIGEGDRIVYQRMEVCDRFPAGSGFITLRNEFQSLWDASFTKGPDYPFESAVEFNDLMLQRYAPGEIGITPHRDRRSYRNVICLFVLAGLGRFGVCADRSGQSAREISNAPGEVILTRAPGFLGSGTRPFHFVRDISEPRYVFGLRHERR